MEEREMAIGRAIEAPMEALWNVIDGSLASLSWFQVNDLKEVGLVNIRLETG